MNAPTCSYCGSDERDGAVIVASERMYGMGGQFHYRECPLCGSLSLDDPPSLAAYYPEDYYAFTPAAQTESRTVRFIRMLRSAIDSVEWNFPLLAGRHHVVALARTLGIGPQSAVLDVGCGSGAFLSRLRRLGLKKLVGVDPYIPHSIDEPGVRIIRGTLDDVSGKFDAVFCNHSLEHAASPEVVLRRIRALLTQGGVAVIRIPVANDAWRRFHACWVQLDAPRHLTIPSPLGMRALASRTGFTIESVIYDSTSFQFWGSRAYERGMSLRSVVRPPLTPGWFVLVLGNAIGSIQAAYLNAAGKGDQAAFVCRPSNANS